MSQKNYQQGMSLIEILVALAVIASMFAFGLNVTKSQREFLEEVGDRIESTFRYASQQAILKNRLIRLKIDVGSDTTTYLLQAAHHNDILIKLNNDDENKSQNLDALSSEEKELIEKQKNSFDSSFGDIAEIDPQEITLPVRFVAIKLPTSEKLEVLNSSSVFFYSNGEKDHGLLCFANDDEVMVLRYDPFNEDIFRAYTPLLNEENSSLTIEEIQLKTCETWWENNKSTPLKTKREEQEEAAAEAGSP